jgi:hypothetical protein
VRDVGCLTANSQKRGGFGPQQESLLPRPGNDSAGSSMGWLALVYAMGCGDVWKRACIRMPEPVLMRVPEGRLPIALLESGC